jgi:hypothetical protein
MKAVLTLLVVLLLNQICFAQNVDNIPEPEYFPNDIHNLLYNYPQDAGLDNPAKFFDYQVEGGVGPTFTTGFTGGLTGAFPGQVDNAFQGVDPVRGIVVVNLANNGGSSSGGGILRGGVGGASGNGFGITETKYPARFNLPVDGLLDPYVYNEVFFNNAYTLVPSILMIMLIALLI